MRKLKLYLYSSVVTCALLCVCGSYAVTVDTLDDFENGTVMGWGGGQGDPPRNVSSGGPMGVDDAYLRIASYSVDLPSFHLGAKNASQWAGDYSAAGVKAIEMDLNHVAPGSDSLQIRILVFGAGGTFASRDRTTILEANQWTHVRFGLTTNDMVDMSGGAGDLSATLAAVTTLLIRHDSAVPTPVRAHPPHVSESLGIDNIRAIGNDDVNWPQLSTTDTRSGLTRPVYLTHAGDGSDRIFAVEQPGRIQILKDGAPLGTPFLDITSRVAGGTSGGDERGLLGLAFPPGPPPRSHFYVYYCASAASQTVLSRFRVSTNDMDLADAASEEILLTIPQPQQNHNGGQIDFGPDGYLYLATGDGGGGNDDDAGHGSIGNGQNTQTFLGKMLRLDVETVPLTNSYAIPPDNPFVANTNVLDEIWAYGLRNPYRSSFDRDTGDLYIGDVGQGDREEINVQATASPGGENYGWRRYEGSDCTGIQGDSCDTNGLTFPIWEYTHIEGRQAVTGGYVNRRAPTWSFLHGLYLYADYATGEIWGLQHHAGSWHNKLLYRAGFRISGFGENEAGDIFICDIFGGRIERLAELAADTDGDEMPDAYEATYGLAVNDASDADTDKDLDGMSNRHELRAGTDPGDNTSTLQLTELHEPATPETVLRWTSARDRLYSIDHTPSMASNFTPVASNLPATPPHNVYTTATDTANSRFFRIGVQAP